MWPDLKRVWSSHIRRYTDLFIFIIIIMIIVFVMKKVALGTSFPRVLMSIENVEIYLGVLQSVG